MAIITRVNPETTPINSLPQVRNDVRVPDNPLAGLSSVGAQFGDIAQRHYEKKVAENDSAVLLDARRQYDEFENSMFDPQNQDGFEQYKGADSLRAVDDLVPLSRKKIEELGANMTPNQLARWNEIGMNADTAFSDRLRRDSYKRHDEFQTFTRESAMSSLSNSAAIAIGSGDEATATSKLQELESVISADAELKFGHSADATEVIRKKMSAVYAGGISQALARGDLGMAESIFDKRKDSMDSDDITRIENALEPFRVDREVEATLDSWATGAPNEVSGGNVTEDIFKAQEQAESNGDNNAVSSKGAFGVMQIMPATAANPGYGMKPLARNASAAENRAFGREYMKRVTADVGGDVRAGLAAYNWGVGNFKRALAANKGDVDAAIRSAPKETRDYVAKITKNAGSGQGGAPSFYQMEQRARAEFANDPRKRDVALSKINQRQAADRSKEADLMDTTLATLASASVWDDPNKVISAADRAELERRGKWVSVVNYAQSRQRSNVVADDDETVGSLMLLMKQDPQDFARRFDPIKYRDKLTFETLQQLSSSARSIREGKAKKDDEWNYATDDEILNANVFSKLGITGESQNAKGARNQFLGQWLKVKRSWAQRNPGKKMTSSEMETEVNRLATSFALNNVSQTWTTGKGKNKSTLSVDYGKTFGNTVPAQERTRIIASFQKHGVSPSEQDIRDAFLAGQ